MRPLVAFLLGTLLWMTLLANAFLYWSCQVQNAFVASNATCDCNALVRSTDTQQNALAVGEIPRQLFNSTYLIPPVFALLPATQYLNSPLLVDKTLALLTGHPSPCFRPPAVDFC